MLALFCSPGVPDNAVVVEEEGWLVGWPSKGQVWREEGQQYACIGFGVGRITGPPILCRTCNYEREKKTPVKQGGLVGGQNQAHGNGGDMVPDGRFCLLFLFSTDPPHAVAADICCTRGWGWGLLW